MSDLLNKKIKEKGEIELWLEIPVDTRLSKEFLSATLKYRFINDNPDVGLDLEKPLIEINGEKLTCDEALKKMIYYFGDDEEKYELHKSARKPKII